MNGKWEEPTLDDSPSEDAEESTLEESDVPASDHDDAADDEDMDDLFEDIPEEHRDVVKKYAQKAERRIAGKQGQRIREYQERERAYQQQIAQTQQRPKEEPTEDDEVRKYLKKVVPELDELNSLKEVTRTLAVQKAESDMGKYLDGGPGKYKHHFSKELRSTLEDAYRANNYQGNSTIRALENSIENIMKQQASYEKANGRNKANVGQDGSSYSGTAPKDAAVVENGNFDWHRTMANIERMKRGG